MVNTKVNTRVKRKIERELRKQMTKEELQEFSKTSTLKVIRTPHFALFFYPADWKKPKLKEPVGWVETQLRKIGYQLEMETPRFHDWLVATTDNPDTKLATDVFLKIAKIWAEEVGIPDKHLKYYQKYRYENNPSRQPSKRKRGGTA